MPVAAVVACAAGVMVHALRGHEGVNRADGVRTAGPHSMMVWSKGDVYLSSPSASIKPSETARPVGTAGW